LEQALGLPTRYINSSSPVNPSLPSPKKSTGGDLLSHNQRSSRKALLLLSSNGSSDGQAHSLSELDKIAPSKTSPKSLQKPTRQSKLKQRFASLSAVNEDIHQEVTTDFRSEFVKRKPNAKLRVDTSITTDVARPSTVSSIQTASAHTHESPQEKNDGDELPELIYISVPAVSAKELSKESRDHLEDEFYRLYLALKQYQIFLREIKPLLVKEDPDYSLKLEFYQELHGMYKVSANNYAQIKSYLQEAPSGAVQAATVDKATQNEPEEPRKASFPLPHFHSKHRPVTPSDPKLEKHLLKKEIQRLKSTLKRLQQVDTESSEVKRQLKEIQAALSSYYARYQEIKGASEEVPSSKP
jgi:hypothetical protein